MRNTGWYIPFWRRPKKKGKAERPNAEQIIRTDEQLEAVRLRWIDRYRRMVRALNLLGLSVGSNRNEVYARYEHLRAAGTVPARELEDAFRFLVRVLPPQERRRRRPPLKESRNAARPDGDESTGAASSVATEPAPDLREVENVDEDAAAADISEPEYDEEAADDGDEDDAGNDYEVTEVDITVVEATYSITSSAPPAAWPEDDPGDVEEWHEQEASDGREDSTP